jgi:uncharacterized protein YbcI
MSPEARQQQECCVHPGAVAGDSRFRWRSATPAGSSLRSSYLPGVCYEERREGRIVDGTTQASGDRGKVAAAISDAITGMYREHFGRGASRTRTVMGADYIVCFMEDVYTPVERTLIEAGRFAAVQVRRNAFQDTMREKFSSAVEDLTGRKVVGFLSAVHVDPDLSVETFILHPDGAASATA